MGYRSEVLIKVPEHRWEQYKQMAEDSYAQQCKANNYQFQLSDVFEGATITHCEGSDWCVPYVAIHFDWVKWYDSYFDVRAIMDSLYEMHDTLGMSYSYARSGEESGDIDLEHGNGEKEEEEKDVPYCDVIISLE